jgi:hypothetical protein
MKGCTIYTSNLWGKSGIMYHSRVDSRHPKNGKEQSEDADFGSRPLGRKVTYTVTALRSPFRILNASTSDNTPLTRSYKRSAAYETKDVG